MKLKNNTQISKKDIEKLLSGQTLVILGAVEEKMAKLEKKFDGGIEKFGRKLEGLITTLDRFLKRLTDAEDEFAIMKADVNRMKKVIKEKLGVEL